MKRIATSLATAAFALAAAPFLLPAAAHADTLHAHTESLQMKVKQEKRMNLPRRGMLMKQVRAEYGPPLKVLPTRGGSSKYQPPIHRWEYAKYIVYFEYHHVIHTVLRTPGPDSL